MRGIDQIKKEIRSLSELESDRRQFHANAHPLLRELGKPEQIHEIFERNLIDSGYLHRQWSTYEIPFLFIDETDHFYLKFHVFPPVASRDKEKAANIIHHHNNYLLTSLTVQGPGYHTLHFDPELGKQNQSQLTARITKDFFHGSNEFSFVDSYEPHLVFNMDALTTTLVLWSPDRKLPTDSLRNNRVIKPFKKPVLKVVKALGLSRQIGVADKKVYQWYVENGKIIQILEEDYFGMYKAVTGPEVDDFYTQAVCKFVQQSGYTNKEFLRPLIDKQNTPKHWQKWLSYLIEDKEIPEVFGKEEFNIPSKRMMLEDVRKTCS
jgi:hypothetical protein